jgi:hypothetical protein
MKEFLSNIPMYIGNIFNKISNIFYIISFFMHTKLNTKTGKVLKKTAEQVQEYLDALQKLKVENKEDESGKLKKMLIKGN